jgi:hypothetical protein
MGVKVTDKDIIIADSNALLWVLGAILSVGICITVIAEDRHPDPSCVSYEQALEAGVMSYPAPDTSGKDCG